MCKPLFFAAAMSLSYYQTPTSCLSTSYQRSPDISTSHRPEAQKTSGRAVQAWGTGHGHLTPRTEVPSGRIIAVKKRLRHAQPKTSTGATHAVFK